MDNYIKTKGYPNRVAPHLIMKVKDSQSHKKWLNSKDKLTVDFMYMQKISLGE